MFKSQTVSKHSYNDKWPPIVAKMGFTQVPNCLIQCRESLGLSVSELSTLLQLMAYDFGSKKVWPAHSTLAEQAGFSVATVRRNIVKLEKKEYIHRIFRTGTSNEFDLLPSIKTLKKHRQFYCVQKKKPLSSFNNKSPPSNTNTKEDLRRRRKSKTEQLSNLIEHRKGMYNR